MTANEIVDKVKAHLEGWGRLGWPSVHQEPYKGDLFKLCKAAHAGGYHDIRSSPRLTSDGLYDALHARWNENVDEATREALEDVCRMWGEWLYALDHA